MTNSGYAVFIVEDDPSVRDALGLLLGLNGHAVVPFADAETFLAAYRPEWHGCLLLDIRMPGMDGLSLQRCLLERGSNLPVIVMSGHGDVQSARDAFRNQALDFLEKPVDHERLLAAIEEAFTRQRHSEENLARRSGFDTLLASLTPREREILEEVVAGRPNREIADELGISPRTVEVHKARMMAKLQASSVPDLIRRYLTHADRLPGD